MHKSIDPNLLVFYFSIGTVISISLMIFLTVEVMEFFEKLEKNKSNQNKKSV
jgi:ABC-type nickel/cobalt efflux system permease component RcnA